MTLGWIGNMFIVAALVLLGQKRRVGWLFSFIGNFCWCWYAVTLHLWDVLAIDGLCLVLAIYYWFLWRK